MENISIRNISVDDVPRLRECVSRCKPLDLHTPFTYWIIANYFSKWSYVMLHNDNVIGFITAIKTSENSIYIWQVGVINEYRKQGLSNILIDNIAKQAISENMNVIQVTIDSGNFKSINAFKKYFEGRGYQMKKAGNLIVTDLLQKDFYSEEDIYEFNIGERP